MVAAVSTENKKIMHEISMSQNYCIEFTNPLPLPASANLLCLKKKTNNTTENYLVLFLLFGFVLAFRQNVVEFFHCVQQTDITSLDRSMRAALELFAEIERTLPKQTNGIRTQFRNGVCHQTIDVHKVLIAYLYVR